MLNTNKMFYNRFSVWRWYKERYSGRRFTRSSREKKKPHMLWFCELNASHSCVTADLQEHRAKLSVFVSFLLCGHLQCSCRPSEQAKPVRTLVISVAPSASADSLLLWRQTNMKPCISCFIMVLLKHTEGFFRFGLFLLIKCFLKNKTKQKNQVVWIFSRKYEVKDSVWGLLMDFPSTSLSVWFSPQYSAWERRSMRLQKQNV